MLEAAGKNVIIGGNIGIPMIDLLDKVTPTSFVVLEISSFQLCDLGVKSPHIAVCVMVAPEHLNWHKDLEDYLKAKEQLFKHQDENDIAVYFEANEYSTRIAATSPGTKIPYFAPPGAYEENYSY
jgi:UDP-N-acetylmuramoylalanine--D-glutamate ligase